MELELSDFDLPTALDNALMLVRERAQRRNLILNREVDAGVGQIQGDERKIRLVILNLLSNAIKFTCEQASWMGMTPWVSDAAMDGTGFRCRPKITKPAKKIC